MSLTVFCKICGAALQLVGPVGVGNAEIATFAVRHRHEARVVIEQAPPAGAEK
jgi:hypothetical protein